MGYINFRQQDSVNELDLLIQFFDSSQDIFIISSYAGQILRMNEVLAWTLGYAPDEFAALFKNSQDGMACLHDDDAASVKNLLSELKEKGGHTHFHCRHQYKDGAILWIGWNVVADPIGKRVFSVGREFTGYIKIQDNLRLSEEKFSKAFYDNQSLMALYSQEGNQFIDVNRKLVSLSGYSQQEIVGQSHWDLFGINPADRQNLMNQLMRDGYVENFEYPYRKKSGEIGHVIVSMNTLNINDTRLIIASGIDVTNRRAAEAALRESRDRFSKAFHSSPSMMAINRVKDGRFVDVNAAWQKRFGFSRDEVFGLDLTELHICDPEMLNKIEVSSASGDTQNVELYCRTKTGQNIIVLSALDIIEVEGETCFLSTSLDVTQQKEMQEQMARLDRLNLVGAMAAAIGHEIRNPMTSIRGFLQILSSYEEYKKDRVYFDLMIEELDRANGIITEFLGMARDKSIDLKYRNLNSIVASLYPMIESDAHQKEMKIVLDLHETTPILADDNEIRQLILNMTRNALEAMAPGGTLTIETRLGKDDIVLLIKDEGQGLSPHLLDKLGTPFVTTKENGTGLGLAVCYSIAARHSARIDFDTGSNGTVFKVYFPFPIEQIQLF